MKINACYGTERSRYRPPAYRVYARAAVQLRFGRPLEKHRRSFWEMGITIDPKLVVQLEKDISSPELGYPVMQQLLAQHLVLQLWSHSTTCRRIGAIRALQDFGLRVPADVSVIGLDDIHVAAFNNPRLTTIRQPLTQLGRTAAQCALSRLLGSEPFREQITFEPELVVRESTQAVKSSVRASARESLAGLCCSLAEHHSSAMRRCEDRRGTKSNR